jgi:outer membrane receptor protein involved in Fe transport
LNGLFEFRTSASFEAANPSTYPERLQIRVPGAMSLTMRGHFAAAFLQDRWLVSDRLTLSLGIRYDIEAIPVAEDDNPAFADPTRYPLDTNNVAPRLGFTYSFDAARRSVLRGGYGIFYDKTAFELIAPIVAAGKFSPSFMAFFPANGVDPGPSQGRLPTEPLLRNGPIVDREAIAQLFPPGARSRNLGTVFFDRPDRRVPNAEQFSIGYSRQIGTTTAVGVDFVHARGRDQLMTRDLNPALRVDTSRTGTVTRPNPEFAAAVLEYSNLGRSEYDALETHLEKRYGRGFSARVSYTLAYSRGNTAGTGNPQVLSQLGDDLRLDANHGPTDFDRRHNLVVSGTYRVPRTGGLTVSGIARALSGLPFTIIDSSTDPDRNGILFDSLPAGTYSGTGRNAMAVAYKGGRNGAYGPGFFQLDLRAGYRLVTDGSRTLDVFGELFNVSDRAAFDNPVTAVLGHPAADRRLMDFLVLRSLRPGSIPRTGQIGVRFGF